MARGQLPAKIELISLLVGGFVLSINSFAVPVDRSSVFLPNDSRTSSSTFSRPFEGTLDFSTFHYPSFSSQDPRGKVQTSLTGRLQSGFKSQDLRGFLDAEVMGMPGSPGAPASDATGYFTVSEAYVSQKIDSQVTLSFGRKLQEWSQQDESWKMGLWQPRFRWDCLSPQEQGLTGFFADYHEADLQVSVFGTPLFIPEQGGTYDLTDGQFKARSPCFEAPGASLEILKIQTDARYQINMPPLQKLVLNPGAGTTARWGSEKGPWGRLSYAYKPMNQILIDYDGNLQLDEKVARVQVSPRVAYHHIATAEAGFQSEKWGGWFGVTAERPLRSDLPTRFTGQQRTPAISVGPTLTWTPAGPSGAVWDVGYLRHWGGEVETEGELAAQGALAEARYPYGEALSFGAKTRFSGSVGRKLTLSSRFIYDLSVEGSFLSTELRYHPSPSFSVGLGADLLKVGSKGAEDTSVLISRFRGNDRVYAGVRYAF